MKLKSHKKSPLENSVTVLSVFGAFLTSALSFTSNPPLALVSGIIGVFNSITFWANHSNRRITDEYLKKLNKELEQITSLEARRKRCEDTVREEFERCLKEKGSDKYGELYRKYGM